MDNNELVAKLKADLEQRKREDYEAGKEAGKESVRNADMDPKELDRLAGYINEFERDGRVCWHDTDNAIWAEPFGATAHFAFAVRPECNEDRDGAAAFWEDVLGDDAGRIVDGDFFHGFGDGAVEAWGEVREQVMGRVA